MLTQLITVVVAVALLWQVSTVVNVADGGSRSW